MRKIIVFDRQRRFFGDIKAAWIGPLRIAVQCIDRTPSWRRRNFGKFLTQLRRRFKETVSIPRLHSHNLILLFGSAASVWLKN
ncbi:MAG: hypothetical protein ACRECV_07035 [Xanthobacteraceae bacterium]